MTISIVIWIGFIKNESNELKGTKENIIYISKAIGIFVFSYILNVLASKLILWYFNIESTSYLKEQIGWLNLPISQNIQNITRYIRSVITGEGIFYNYFYLLSIIIVVTYILKQIINKTAEFWKTFYLVMALLSPFFLSILIGNVEPIRAQFVLSYAMAFICSYIIINKKIDFLKLLVVIIFLFNQIYITTSLFYSDYIRYQEDTQLANDIAYRVEPLMSENTKVVFIGAYIPKSNSIIIKGDVMGKSFFEWDANEIIGSNSRAINFMNTLGFHSDIPTPEEYEIAKEQSIDMDIWPSNKSVKEYDNLIIVKLN